MIRGTCVLKILSNTLLKMDVTTTNNTTVCACDQQVKKEHFINNMLDINDNITTVKQQLFLNREYFH